MLKHAAETEDFLTFFSPKKRKIFGSPKSQVSTEVPEIQDVMGPKRVAPPLAPLQPKLLGQFGSFFGDIPLVGLYQGASRRFLNLILEAEI